MDDICEELNRAFQPGRKALVDLAVQSDVNRSLRRGVEDSVYEILRAAEFTELHMFYCEEHKFYTK